MARISDPSTSVPLLLAAPGTMQVTVLGATDTTTANWRIVLADDLPAEWDCPVSSVVTVTGGVKLTVTVPSGVPPVALDLVARLTGSDVARAIRAVGIKTTMTPDTLDILRFNDRHGRYDSVQPNVSSEPDRTPSQWRTWSLVRQCVPIINLINPWCTDDGGDQTHQVIEPGKLTSGDAHARFLTETAGTRVPGFLTRGNHDADEGTDNTQYKRMLELFGPMYGKRTIATNFDFLLHDYGNPASKTAILAFLGQAKGNVRRYLSSHFHQGWSSIAANVSGVDEYFVGHLHHWDQLSDHCAMTSAAQKYGQATRTRYRGNGAGWNCDFDISSFPKTVTKKLIGTYKGSVAEAQLMTQTYSAPNDGTATKQIITTKIDLDLPTADGRVYAVMATGRYTCIGGTIVSQYDSLDGTKTRVVVKVAVPGSGSFTVQIGRSSDSPTPPVVTPPVVVPSPPANNTQRMDAFVFNSMAEKDGDNNALTAADYAPGGRVRTDVLTVQARNKFSEADAVSKAGYVGPRLLYTLFELVLNKTLVYRRTNQCNDGTEGSASDGSDADDDLQPYADAIAADSTCFMYTSNNYIADNIIRPVNRQEGVIPDPAHPKVRALWKRAFLKWMRTYRIQGMYVDNLGIYPNAKRQSGEVWSKYLGAKYTSATLDQQEMAALTEIRTYVEAQLGRKILIYANVLAEADLRDLRGWNLDGLMFESPFGFTYDDDDFKDSDNVWTKITNGRQWLADNADHTLIVTAQVKDNTKQSLMQYGFGISLMMVPAYTQGPAGRGRLLYNPRNASKYGTWFFFNSDYSKLGMPTAAPVRSGTDGNIFTRQFEFGQAIVNVGTRTFSTNKTAAPAGYTLDYVSPATPPPTPNPDPVPPVVVTGSSLAFPAFYGLPAKDVNGATLDDAFFADKIGLFIPYSENRASELTTLRGAGYTGPALLQVFLNETILDATKTSGTSRQWNDGSSDLQPYANAVAADATCFYYSDAACTQKIVGFEGNGYVLDGSKAKVQDLARRGALKKLQSTTALNGIFFNGVGVWENARRVSGKVYSKTLNREITSAEMDANEQALLSAISSYVTANLGRAWLRGINLLSASQERPWTGWPADLIFIEGWTGYTQSGGFNSARLLAVKLQRAAEWLAVSTSKALVCVNQVGLDPDGKLDKYGYGAALAILPSGNRTTPEGLPRVSYRLTNYNEYDVYRTTAVDTGNIGDPTGTFTIANGIANRTFSQGVVQVDMNADKHLATITPQIVDPTPPNNSQVEATVVGVHAPSGSELATAATTRSAPGEPVDVDGVPYAVVFVRAQLSGAQPASNKVSLNMPVAVGADGVVPQVQLVDDFNPATITWATRPAARGLTYDPKITAIVSDTTMSLDITSVAQRAVGTVISLALLLDSPTGITLHPSATIVWE